MDSNYLVLCIGAILLTCQCHGKEGFEAADPGNLQSEDAEKETVDNSLPQSDASTVALLQQQVIQLSNMVNMLKIQNAGFEQRIASLELCECRRGCVHDGIRFTEQQVWRKDACTICTCENGETRCDPDREKAECKDPCLSLPCLNGGSCILGIDNYTCECAPYYSGPQCQHYHCPCLHRPDPGSCDNNQLATIRFYFNITSQRCERFTYSGCDGNPNNFERAEECERSCNVGACCHRTYTRSVQNNIERVTLQPGISCQVTDRAGCRAEVGRTRPGVEVEVVSFKPSRTCDGDTCRAPVGCRVDGVSYTQGQEFHLGCEQCVCLPTGNIHCSCKTTSIRKELRDMTRAEVQRFQSVVGRLRKMEEGSIWERYRDMYNDHAMHAHQTIFFLPWHRLFLRRLEQKLQSIDCNVVLPYFDFTTDAGTFGEAILWQANMFGGDGHGGCVAHNPFQEGSSWKPCIVRNFNSSVRIPSIVEMAIALSQDDYMNMSSTLQSLLAYVHVFIGGDMATTHAAYDPVFYAIHAYADMLFWQWQRKGNTQHRFPADYLAVPMLPFFTPPIEVLDLEGQLCVTYLLPSRGHPCNRTEQTEYQPEEILEFSEDGYDQFGYNRDGYDQLGYNRDGYNRQGFNRDGYDEAGYNRAGYDRYGFNRSGFNRRGYDWRGLDYRGNRDPDPPYDNDGYDALCLDRKGLNPLKRDRYGFTKSGYDVYYCNYSWEGPFALLQSLRVWEILYQQSPDFLMGIPRICYTLELLPLAWKRQFWVEQGRDVTGLVRYRQPRRFETTSMLRTCVDLTHYLSNCPCPEGYAQCEVNPCLDADCPSHPGATCEVSLCGQCEARWFVAGRQVHCHDVDFCSPNPCLNGGVCRPSRWTKEPELVTCQCPGGWEGNLCQNKVNNPCSMPLITGNCISTSPKWRFDKTVGDCVQYQDTSCLGNSNSFPSYDTCAASCVKGACCYRTPLRPEHHYGYDLQGYDRYGFNIAGFNRDDKGRTIHNGVRTGSQRFNDRKLDWEGYDKDGFDSSGYDRHGYDREGYHSNGFNMTGYSRFGEFDGIIDYNSDGFDEQGYDRSGFNCYGINGEGLNYFGLNAGFIYNCRSATEDVCREMEDNAERIPIQVVKFSRGKRCSEVDCGETCGCSFNGKSYKFGDIFTHGCQRCRCQHSGSVECACSSVTRRKEIRDLTLDEWKKFQDAVKQLAESSQWLRFAHIHAESIPQAYRDTAFLPWHRYFLRLVEMELQKQDCDIAIPYFDWTVDAGSLESSSAWQANHFGGDGEEGTHCVRNHPFKDYHPPYWTQCLRRHFNTTIHVPDAVDLYHILNEDTYDRFQGRLRAASDLFHLWVGGHMKTDFRSYDPIFFSHFAFIDKLWDDWQKRSPDGLLKYPWETRYSPMEPFYVSADDVMSSKEQMCMEYAPLTLGITCNITVQYKCGFDKDGYDRHGYNSYGYDRGGFNKQGVDRFGSPDQRGIFDSDGFDREGYKRSGFDLGGFDRFGFSLDSYNRDGFDCAGFDRWNYDRYGFNKRGVTPYGFLRNGSFESGLTEASLDQFDTFGYNRYGINKYGYDRHGYDIFGFDSLGFDKRFCNSYWSGPFYGIYKRWADLQLEDLSPDLLSSIPRLCEEVSVVPEWWRVRNWHRGSRGRAQVYDPRTPSQRPLQSPTPLRSSVTADNLWLPHTPDSRFCFHLHYFSGCLLGTPPVSCREDLCSRRTCSGNPEALCRVRACGTCTLEWYDGITGQQIECQEGCVDKSGRSQPEGSRWRQFRCQDCFCQNGEVSCAAGNCPPVNCSNPVPTQDGCCSNCDGCSYGGRVYRNRARILPENRPCVECSCSSGSVTCKARGCPADPFCQSPITLEGDCCPTCLDCGDRANGTQWAETPCRQCACVNGQISCTDTQCPDIICTHPRTPRGQCCPLCKGCEFEGRNLRNGETFRPDACRECQCRFGSVQCRTTTCPPLLCHSPVRRPGECCPQCPQGCEYDGGSFLNGEYFTPSFNACLNCSCLSGIVRCSPLACPPVNLPCNRPVPRPGQCCPSICPKCVQDGVEYENGADWLPASDPCQRCSCVEGLVSCGPVRECAFQCTHGVLGPGECCSPCQDCLYEGEVIRDGHTFVQQGSVCRQCQCRRGNVQCRSAETCPALRCRLTEVDPTSCCPRCRSCVDSGGVKHDHGAQWTDQSDKCATCVCREGRIDCRRADCQVSCSNPASLPGDCCPRCDSCLIEGVVYRNNQQVPSQERCTTCHCSLGSMQCRPTPCLPVSCAEPVLPPGGCCPVCGGCTYQGTTYSEGQRFPSRLDPCEECSCQAGRVECGEKPCDPAPCTHPYKPGGACCPTCQECLYKTRRIRNGQAFVDPDDACQHCKCEDGSVVCQTQTCAPVTCRNPEVPRGRCCPQCREEVCIFQGRRIPEGQRFSNPADRCETCVCREGRVQCQGKVCPPVSCTHPREVECCKTCDGCQYDGDVYQDGQRFSSRSDPCRSCVCQRGSVQCTPLVCPPVTCANPIQGACCQECDGCFYGNQKFGNGEIFPDPEEECQECTCHHGDISCRLKTCPAVNCRYPVQGKCCDECDGCFHGNNRYRNGEVFQDTSSPCKECRCRYGDIDCKKKPCTRPVCRHPVAGECCPQCGGDCLYEEVQYRNNQVFARPEECQECHCREGSVYCQRKSCPHAPCRHPVEEDCCPHCEDCRFLGEVHSNGERFTHPTDTCKQCTCQSGDVVCVPPQCHTRCLHPAPGQCCPECHNCRFENRLYQNGQTFQPDPCRTCRCSLGNVLCDSQTCPALTCPRRVTPPGQCCEKCQACVYEGKEYSEGALWISEADTCMSCSCVQSVVTCTELTCITPCVNPKPLPGKCCPVCPGCSYNGITYKDGQSFTPSGNPCDVCTCEDGNMKCIHQVCPSMQTCPQEQVLPPLANQCCPKCAGFGSNCSIEHIGQEIQPGDDPCYSCTCKAAYNWVCEHKVCRPLSCPVSEQIQSPDVCCPKCTGCEHNGMQFIDQQSWTKPDDPCVICQCNRGVVSCRAIQCVMKACPSGWTQYVPPGQCCPVCHDPAQLMCTFKGKTYQAGSHWVQDECSNCSCVASKVNCTTHRCPPLLCESDETPTLDPGLCCPKCIPKPATCVVYGDPHYRTFDGQTIHFQGTCRYVMAQDCERDTFRLEAEHDDRGSFGEVSWVKNLKLHIDRIEVDLLQKSKVQVNGFEVKLPYLRESVLMIEKNGHVVHVNTNLGVKILWTGDSYAEISVPGSYKEKLCGLCGNFNSFPQDDMRTRSGHIASSEAVFGNSWKLPDSPPSCQSARDIDPCVQAGFRMRKMANAKCAVLKTPKFQRCHRVISPEPYYAACVYDMCSCAENAECLCDVLSTYALACANAGVALNWRTTSLCAIGCPAEHGFVFDECGPFCARTCANKDKPLDVITEQCFKPCIPGCQCQADKVLHEGRCITPDSCPK